MDQLYAYHDILLQNVSFGTHRYLYSQIDWSLRFKSISGARGTGKTTMILQHIRDHFDSSDLSVLYVTMEHPYFYQETLFDFLTKFYQYGGRHVYIDEVHKYPNWSQELKVAYDGYPDLQMTISSSSAIELGKGTADLSRRLTPYTLRGLSYREYLNFTLGMELGVITIGDILTDSRKISNDISSKVSVLPHFKNYLKWGYYPFHLESNEDDYFLKLIQVIDTVMQSDLAIINNYTIEASRKVRKLLGVIAESAPIMPNLSAIARKTLINRETLYSYIAHLERARIINSLYKESKGMTSLQKPEKIYLNNTNLSYALQETPDVGNIRETFMLNQLHNADLRTSWPIQGDFLLPDHNVYIEVGGKNKKKKQLSNVKNGIVAKDNTIIALGNTVPLWLFGFLY